jgi:hypothetical protein
MVNLMDNDAAASLTDREQRLLAMLGRCVHYLSDLNGSRWIGGDDAGAADMRQRAAGLRDAACRCITNDPVTDEAWYGRR